MRPWLKLGDHRLRLTIVERLPNRRLRCRCECGATTIIPVSEFGRTNSCGCWRRELLSKRGRYLQLRHDQSRTAEYRAWHGMKNRCLNPNAKEFKDWGARGIRVCDRWLHSFENFRADVGPRPSVRHSLSRLDNDGHYEPNNVRWETQKEQTRNRRTTRLLSAFGKTQCLSDWAIEYGLHVSTLTRRLRVGVPLEHALTAPLNQL